MNALRLFLLLFVAILCGAKFALGQCDHTSTRMSRFEHDRFMPIVARGYDGAHLLWSFSDDQGVFGGQLNLDASTKLPPGFSAGYKNQLFWAIYSECDDYAYAIYTMSPEQLKQFKKYNPK